MRKYAVMKVIKCPTCQKEITWSKDYPFRPFCCERCRLIDLGSWADGSYAIPSVEPPEDEDIEDSESEQGDSGGDESGD